MPISGPDSGSRHDWGVTPRLLKLVAGVLSLGFVLVPAAGAQQSFGQGQLQETGPMVSVWEGVFTEAQATRGEAAYEGACGTCHGSRLNGAPDDPDMRSSPPVARARFLRVWEGLSLGTLLAYTRATMPEENPNSLTGQEYVDVIAYQLSVSGMPAGDRELPPDPYSLGRVVIQPRP
jgi:mono/diheme cytochrome c family protein